MASEQLSQAESNKALVERRFERAIAGDREAVVAMQSEDYTIRLNYGHPAGGTFQGIEDTGAGRLKMISLLGITSFWLDDVIASDSDLVVALVGAKDTDVDGNEWSMPAVELIKVVDGLVTETNLIYQDSAQLRDIALGREAAA